MQCRVIVIFKVIMVWLFIFWSPAYGEEAPEGIIERFETGTIDWSKRVVEAEGTGCVSQAVSGNQEIREKAMILARQEVHRNLLETIKKLQVTATQKLEDITKKRDTVLSAVERLLRDAPVVKTDYLTDGSVKVKVQVSLDGALSQLILPNEIVQLESINTGTNKSCVAGKNNNSGIIIDARGLPFKPALSYRLIDENNVEVYGPKYVSRDCAVQWGICEYTNRIDAVNTFKRLGENPLMVKAVRLAPSNASTIIISDTDASKIRNSAQHLIFLKECRVLIVVDNASSKQVVTE